MFIHEEKIQEFFNNMEEIMKKNSWKDEVKNGIKGTGYRNDFAHYIMEIHRNLAVAHDIMHLYIRGRHHEPQALRDFKKNMVDIANYAYLAYSVIDDEYDEPPGKVEV